MNSRYLVEILTPKQSSEHFEAELEIMAQRYNKVLDSGFVASIPDNPMGIPRFNIHEIISELDLKIAPEQLLIHLNTFHPKKEIDTFLRKTAESGVRYLLLVSGDGGGRLSRLSPEDLHVNALTISSVELMDYVKQQYGGQFHCGVAFNPYEPAEHESEKLKRKIEHGAEFIISQPTVEFNQNVDNLKNLRLPVYAGAWMSRNIDLLSACTGYKINPPVNYDPAENLKKSLLYFPGFGVYISLFGFEKQFSAVSEILKNHHISPESSRNL